MLYQEMCLRTSNFSWYLYEKLSKCPHVCHLPEKIFPDFFFLGGGGHVPPPRPLSYAYMFYSVSVYCVLFPWYGKHCGILMYFVQSFSFSVSFLSKFPIASKCPAPNRPRRVGRVELASPNRRRRVVPTGQKTGRVMIFFLSATGYGLLPSIVFCYKCLLL